MTITAQISITSTATATINCLHYCTGTSADYPITLPAASGNAGNLIAFQMGPIASLSKRVTLDGNASETIDGATTRVMWALETAILYCDGSNWFKVSGKSIPMLATMRLSTNQTGVAYGVLTKCNIDTSVYDDVYAMVDTTNKKIICKRPSQYSLAGGVRWSALTSATDRISTLLYKNGAQLQTPFSEGPGSNATYPATPGLAVVGLIATDYVELYGYHENASNQTFYGHATNACCYLAVTEIITW